MKRGYRIHRLKCKYNQNKGDESSVDSTLVSKNDIWPVQYAKGVWMVISPYVRILCMMTGYTNGEGV